MKIAISTLVVIHLIASLWHGDAHTVLDIGLPGLKNLFVYVVILAGPIAGATLIWTRHFALGAGLVFGFARALQQKLGILGTPIPSEFLSMLPYIVTIIVVAGVVGGVDDGGLDRCDLPDQTGGRRNAAAFLSHGSTRRSWLGQVRRAGRNDRSARQPVAFVSGLGLWLHLCLLRSFRHGCIPLRAANAGHGVPRGFHWRRTRARDGCTKDLA